MTLVKRPASRTTGESPYHNIAAKDVPTLTTGIVCMCKSFAPSATQNHQHTNTHTFYKPDVLPVVQPGL